MTGTNIANQAGTYGAKAAANNFLGAREDAVSWIDSSGNLWLSGSDGCDSTGTGGYLNDLLRY
jgi:hypothetical protein